MQKAIKSTLSKTRYAAGLQCTKRLWLQAHCPEKAPAPSPHIQFLFDQGQRVGIEARKLFAEGILVSEKKADLREALTKTKDLMQERPSAIFEGAFTQGNVNIRVDILEKTESDSWNLIEVKSSTKVKKEHIPDVAIQLWVLSQSGVKIERCYLMHVNKDYVYGAPLTDFFSREDVTDKVTSFLDKVSEDVPKLLAVLTEESKPQIEMGPFCKAPQSCEFIAYCKSFRADNHITEIPRLGKKYYDLIADGILQIQDIPDHFRLSEAQARVRECVINGCEFIDPELHTKLKHVTFPIYYLDFETVASAFPLFPETRSYQVIPFQYSLHVLNEFDGEPDHREYLHREQDNPMTAVAVQLLKDIGDKGSICTYTSYERTQIKTLANHVPEHREALMALIPRLWDLEELIKKNYYHPGFYGSFSIKRVLPVVVPGMSYEAMEVAGGGEATVEYLKLMDPECSKDEQEKIAQGLLDYCCQDTLAMLRVHQALLKKCEA